MLTSYYGNTITYDAIGNPLSWGDYGELTWQGRRLESYTDSESEETFTYTYNFDGIRTSKTIDGVEHIYHLSGTQVLSEEWTENGVQHLLIYIYDVSGAPIGMAYRDSTYVSGDFDIYLFAKNIQGDILYIYNTSGTRLVTYTYDAWGNVTTSYSNGGASTAARHNPFRYRGYYYDTETGFYYLNSRYYDPSVGRFLNADGQLNGTILGYNLFAYCESNPIMWYDPYGYAVNSLFSDERLFSSSFSSSLLGGGGSIFSSSYIYNDIYHTEINPTYDAWSRMQAYDEWFWSSGLNFNSTLYNPAHNATSDSSYGNSACFVAGTLVETENGSLPIEVVEVGMRVYSHDPVSGKTELKEVVRTFVRESDELVHIKVNGEEIICTNEHPFYSPVKGWTSAIDIRAGDILVMLNSEYVVVEQVQHELLETPETTYNFEVADFHTYYVGKNPVLVHNTCEGDYPSRGVGGKGWVGDKTWRENVSTVGKGGTITSLNGGVPSIAQAVQLINESGGTVIRIEGAHPFPNPHIYPHINYVTSTGVKGTIKIFE